MSKKHKINYLSKILLFLITFLFIFFIFFFSDLSARKVNAATWVFSGGNSYNVGTIKISKSNKNVIYAHANKSSEERNFLKSTNYGISWSSCLGNLPQNPDINSIAIHPNNPDIVYIGIYNQGIYRTKDGGQTWSNINTSNLQGKFIRSLAIDVNNPHILFVGTGKTGLDGGIYKSADEGKSWVIKEKNIGKPNIMQIVISPHNSNIIYVSADRVWKSEDCGETWNKLSLNQGASTALTIDPINHNIIYAGQINDGVYKTTNGGLSWSKISQGLGNKRIHCIAVNPLNNNQVFLTTRHPGYGVYETKNAGINWAQINEGFIPASPNLHTAGCAFNEIKEILFAGVLNHGIWKYKIKNSPIILLPGFGGSWNLGAIISGTSAGQWTEIPIFSPYKNIKNTLTSSEAGYIENEDYFEFYYDWRKRIDDLADDLNEYIENTVLVDKPSGTKVNLVGHSMGGLVSRAYADKYGDERIEKTVSVGTPNKGALQSYYAWEGGEIDDKWSLFGIIDQLYLESHKEKHYTTKDVVHTMIPSVQDILPIFDFLKNSTGTINADSMTEQNEYLKGLIDSQSFKDKLITIHGKEINPSKDATEYYIIEEPEPKDKLLGLWTDGKPIDKENTLDGDLTVLTKSATMSGVLSTPQVTGEHIPIIENEEGINTILDALEITNVTPDTSHTSPFTIPLLTFLLGSPANIKVTTPTDDQVGHGVINPGPDTYYSEEDKLIFIFDAPTGIYHVELMGTDDGIYHLKIGQLTEDEDQWQTIKGKIINGDTKNLNLEFNPDDPKENILIDPSGETFLNLAKEQLEDLSEHSRINISSSSTKKRLQYYIKRVIKTLDRALYYFNRKNYYRASRYAFYSLSSSYRLRIRINQYLKRNKINSENAVYIKNCLEEINKLLSSGWINLYQSTGRSISSSKASRYKRAIGRIYGRIENQIEVRAQEGENKDLGIAFSLASDKYQKAQKYLKEGNFNDSYINFVSSRLLLLETLKLLK